MNNIKNKSKGLTGDEVGAMKERLKELNQGKSADGKKAVLAKIASMPERDRAMGKELHEIIMASAPSLMPKTWYGMPAYSNSDGNMVCYFRDTKKFKERYMTLFFSDGAKLDEGKLWPVAFAVTGLTPTEEKKIAALVKKAAG